MQTLKELYLTVFVLFFRFARQSWSDDMNAWKATAWITLFQWALVGGGILWIAALAGYPRLTGLSQLSFLILWFVTYFLNHRVLVIHGYGVKFERHFGQLESRKKTLLVTTAILVTVVSFAFAFWTVVALRPK
jgi:hypothetical protein